MDREFHPARPYQPCFIAATLAFLGYGYWLVYRSSTRVCADGEACARPLPNRIVKTPDHLEYYLAHSLPVLMVLYDPRNGEAWWQHVSRENIRRTDKGRALFVPRDQRLGEQARAPLEAIAQLVTAEERVRIEPVKPLPWGREFRSDLRCVAFGYARDLNFRNNQFLVRFSTELWYGGSVAVGRRSMLT
jgi:hypothetical protein